MSTPPRASLDALLQAAVAERDTSAALRLADQLVHRRGVVALEQLLVGSLAQLQGPDAVAWLRGVVFGAALPAETRAAASAPVAVAPEPPSPAAVARPSLRLVPPQLREQPASPAPTPAALTDLRSWLPGSETAA
jgi:hypothetical protein